MAIDTTYLDSDTDSIMLARPALLAMAKKSNESVSVKDFGAVGDGVTDDTAEFIAASATSLVNPVTINSGDYLVTSDIASSGTWVVEPNVTIPVRQFAGAAGTGGGYLAFEKCRLVQSSLLGQEQVDSLTFNSGGNLLSNPFFAIWQRLDVLGGSSVIAPSPTYGNAATYSGFGGVRTFGPDMWWGKMWSGAYDPNNPVVNPGGGQLALERVAYGSSGDIDSPYHLRATFTGYNPNNIYSTPPQIYTDPVNGPSTDIGTNSVEIGRVIRGARRYGKMTFKMRARWRSGDNTLVVRINYDFGVGGSPSVSVNLQGFALTRDNNPYDYWVHFNVPVLSVDGYGNPIVFGTPGTDYLTLSITSGDNDNFSYDIFGVGLYRGWVSGAWERYDYERDLIACQQEFNYAKVAYAGTTVSGASHGGCAVFSPKMRQAPLMQLAKIDYNSGSFTGGVSSFPVTSGGFGYTSTPTITVIGGGGSGATATAVLTGSAVTGITLTSAGTGYTTPPVLVFSGGGGYGAAGTASLMAGAFAVDQSGGQWWLASGVTGNNSRVVGRIECNAQIVKK